VKCEDPSEAETSRKTSTYIYHKLITNTLREDQAQSTRSQDGSSYCRVAKLCVLYDIPYLMDHKYLDT